LDKNHYPHAIFIDNIMIKMNGPQTIKELRKLEYEGIIIGCSGNVLEEDISSFFDSGAQYFLPKPFNKEILVIICDKICRS
jgi:CheY-like chemotaxis protein